MTLQEPKDMSSIQNPVSLQASKNQKWKTFNTLHLNSHTLIPLILPPNHMLPVEVKREKGLTLEILNEQKSNSLSRHHRTY